MVANTKAKKVSSGKKVAQKEPVKVVSKVEEVVEVVKVSSDIVAPAPEMTESPYLAEFGELMKMADEFLTMARSFKSQVQKLEKQVHRDNKQMMKKLKGKRRRQTDPNAPPSGFAKPGPVSEELSKFLSLAKGEQIARTEVTKAINAYCKKHDLQNQEDKRKIIADAPLRKLLKLNKNDELTFFNLQTYLKVHFPNKEGVYPTA
jgi:chromatin remodeling complex protein RSC6